MTVREICDHLKDKTLTKIISQNTVSKAIKINDFFIKQKLYLAGYFSLDINQVENIDTNGKFFQNKQSIEKMILTSKGSVVFLTDLSKTHLAKKDSFVSACKILQEKKLGNLEKAKKHGSRKISHCFVKLDFDSLSEDEKMNFINSLIEFNVSIETYKSNFLPIVKIESEKNNKAVSLSDEEVSDDEETNKEKNIYSMKRDSFSTSFDKPPKKMST